MDGATRENGSVKRRFTSSSSTDSDTIPQSNANSSHVKFKSARRKKVQRLSYTPPHEKDGRRTLTSSCRGMSSCSNLAAMISNSSEETGDTSKLVKNIPIWRQKLFKNSPVIVKSDPYAFNFTPPASTKIRAKQVNKPVLKSSLTKVTSRSTIGGKSFHEAVATNKQHCMVNQSHSKPPLLKVVRKNVTSPHPAFESRRSSSLVPTTKDFNGNTHEKSPEDFTNSGNIGEDTLDIPYQRARSSPRIQLKKSLSATNLHCSTPMSSTPPLRMNTDRGLQLLNRSLSASNLHKFDVVGTPTYDNVTNTPCTSRKKIISPHPGVRTSPRNQLHSTNKLVRSSCYSLLPVALPSKDDVPVCLPSAHGLNSTPMKYAKPSSYSPLLLARTSPRKNVEKSFSTTNLDISSSVLPSKISSEFNFGLSSPMIHENPEDLPDFAFGRSPILRALIETELNDHNCLRNIDATSADGNNFITPEQSFTSQYFEDVESDVLPGSKVHKMDGLLEANNPDNIRLSIHGTISIPKIESYNSTDSEYASCCSSQGNDTNKLQEDDACEKDPADDVGNLSTVIQGILRKSNCLNETKMDGMPFKNKVGFRSLKVFYFDRQQGGDTVPHAGDVTIGMVGSHFTTRVFSLITGKRPLLTLLESDDASDSEITDDSRYDQREGEYSSNLFLERIDSKQRTRMLKNCGVVVKKNYQAITFIRESRSQCGCSCRGKVCIPSRCECALSGIQCQVDGPANDSTSNTHPCWCTADSCGNPEGRSEFERHKVREHFFLTMKRVTDMEKTGIFCSPTVTRFDEESSEDDVDITSINLNKEYFLKTNNVNRQEVEISNTTPMPDCMPPAVVCNKELLRVASCL